MTGQDAVNSAKAFNEALELDGVILTKLDGDARGGAALSVKAVTGVPIKFIGIGEKLDALEEFHPDGMAGRILGMGDMVPLVEQAQQKFDQEEMARAGGEDAKGEFTLDDFKGSSARLAKLGLMQKILGMMPGMGEAMRAMRGRGHGGRDATDGGHHQFDDPRRASQPRRSSTRAAASGLPPEPACRPRRSTNSSNSLT